MTQPDKDKDFNEKLAKDPAYQKWSILEHTSMVLGVASALGVVHLNSKEKLYDKKFADVDAQRTEIIATLPEGSLKNGMANVSETKKSYIDKLTRERDELNEKAGRIHTLGAVAKTAWVTLLGGFITSGVKATRRKRELSDEHERSR